MAGGYRTKPTPLRDTLREVLDRAGIGGVAVSSTLSSRWAELVGSGIASHSAPQDIKGGRLTVIVDSSTWMNQLSLLSTGIISKINDGMGADTVTELRFRIGKPAPAGTQKKKQGGARLSPPRRKLTADEAADIERAAAAIDDPELRSRARKLLTAAASTRKKA